MKHEWKKKEKNIYLPKDQPEIITIPGYNYFTIDGEGNPNNDFFSEYIGVLYSLSYAVKMSPKKGIEPKGYFDYTVYPLEGNWDVRDEARKSSAGTFSKNDLVFKLMIRQPDFADKNFAALILEETKKKKPHELLDEVKFENIIEGDCIQMMHLGSYDDEPESFKIMEDFAERKNFVRKGKSHREIYLNDPGKVLPDKLKTVLRFCVEKK